MTFTQTGYPDYSRRSARVDQELYSGNIGPGAASNTTGVLATAGARAIGIDDVAVNGIVTITITWYLDQAKTVMLTTQYIAVNQNGDFDHSIPAHGPFLEITAVSGAANGYATLRVWTSDIPGPHNLSFVKTALVYVNAQPIAAGGSYFLYNTVTWPGSASVYIHASTANFNARLEYLDHNAVARLIQGWYGADGTTQRGVIGLPAAGLRLVINNTDVAAQTFDFTVNIMSTLLMS